MFFTMIEFTMVSTGLDNGLVPFRWHAIIWTNVDTFHWQICVLTSINDFKDAMHGYG